MTYEHFVYTKDLPAAETLAGVYQTAGYIASPMQSADEIHGLVMVYTELPYDESGRDGVIAIAEANGATYDGGGAYLGDLEGLT